MSSVKSLDIAFVLY